MIRPLLDAVQFCVCKPRASGDDPIVEIKDAMNTL